MEWSMGRAESAHRKRGRTLTVLANGIVAALLLTVAGPTQAAPKLVPHTYEEPTPEARALAVEDARLNAAYKELAASLDRARREALRDEERQWIRTRDRACRKGDSHCMRVHTANRADELESRIGALAAMSGEWGYITNCTFGGHYTEWSIPKPGSGTIVGQWSDGTQFHESRGNFNGEWRDSRLYVRFCAFADWSDGGETCPTYGAIDGYLVIRGSHLVWFRTIGLPEEGKFREYVTLSRKPRFEDVPRDNSCAEDDD